MKIATIAFLFFAQTDETYLLDALPPSEPPALWPWQVSFPAGLQTYQRARYTQSIATRNDRPAIDSVPRTRTLEKWQVSGGMEGLTGWKSTTYALIPKAHTQWTGYIQVKNSFGYFQPELGYLREFPNGTLFVDLLSHEGKVFELRAAEKQGGQWRRYVAFKDESARPAGYYGLKVTCASCHSKAGQGDYAAPLNPGGDTVFSYPLKYLE